MQTVIISGALANKPLNGGNAWTRLSWASGFQKLGFEVFFVEQIESGNCVDARGEATGFENSINLTYFKTTLERFGLGQRCSLICDHGKKVHGLPLLHLQKKAQQADLIFNISGHLTQPEVMGGRQCKIYFDDDPGFTQIWHAEGTNGSRLAGHDFYYTVGANIGSPDCPIPTNGLTWRHTRPPAVLKHWPMRTDRSFDRFTTVASWRGGYGPVQHKGKTYGIKVHEFRKFLDLPRRNGAKFEVALQIDPADKKDLDALLAHGWLLVNPKETCGTAKAFRDYVASSSAEFSAAQGIYVDTQSGWFSDRTVRYLTSGRPALVQDTGFSGHYPVGEGLVVFRDLDEAVAGAEAIERDYQQHCLAARRIAEEFFDSDRVIGQLVAEVGAPLPEKN
jgi:hypothetical protein